MQEHEVIKILQEELEFTDQSIDKLKMLRTELISANGKHNFIAKSTENQIWSRHILDSAQLVKYINFKRGSLVKYFPKKSDKPNKILIIVGFM